MYVLLLRIGPPDNIDWTPVDWYSGKLKKRIYTMKERLEIMEKIYDSKLSDDYKWEKVGVLTEETLERKRKQEEERKKNNNKILRQLRLTKRK